MYNNDYLIQTIVSNSNPDPFLKIYVFADPCWTSPRSHVAGNRNTNESDSGSRVALVIIVG